MLSTAKTYSFDQTPLVITIQVMLHGKYLKLPFISSRERHFVANRKGVSSFNLALSADPMLVVVMVCCVVHRIAWCLDIFVSIALDANPTQAQGLTRITVKVKVIIRVAVAFILEPSLLSSRTVSERYMPVTKIFEEVNLFLGK